ncbi:MAG: GIY-YIG nuclease family protein [Aliidongia sp.]
MNTEDRKAAIVAYKERKTVSGIYAVRCAASGQVWVGQAPNIGTIQTRIWFGLRHRSSPNRDLQDAWNSHGADSIVFEELERLDEEELTYIRSALLRDRAAHWRATLAARAI